MTRNGIDEATEQEQTGTALGHEILGVNDEAIQSVAERREIRRSYFRATRHQPEGRHNLSPARECWEAVAFDFGSPFRDGTKRVTLINREIASRQSLPSASTGCAAVRAMCRPVGLATSYAVNPALTCWATIVARCALHVQLEPYPALVTAY